MWLTGGCAALTHPTEFTSVCRAGKRSAPATQNKTTVIPVVLLRLKKSAPEGRFPPGAGIAKGAAASPLCTFALRECAYACDIVANGTRSPAWHICLAPISPVVVVIKKVGALRLPTLQKDCHVLERRRAGKRSAPAILRTTRTRHLPGERYIAPRYRSRRDALRRVKSTSTRPSTQSLNAGSLPKSINCTPPGSQSSEYCL